MHLTLSDSSNSIINVKLNIKDNIFFNTIIKIFDSDKMPLKRLKY